MHDRTIFAEEATMRSVFIALSVAALVAGCDTTPEESSLTPEDAAHASEIMTQLAPCVDQPTSCQGWILEFSAEDSRHYPLKQVVSDAYTYDYGNIGIDWVTIRYARFDWAAARIVRVYTPDDPVAFRDAVYRQGCQGNPACAQMEAESS